MAPRSKTPTAPATQPDDEAVAEREKSMGINAPVIPGTWDEIEEGQELQEFETLDPGIYDFYLMDSEKRVGEKSGNEYVVAVLMYERPEAEQEEGKQKTFRIWHNLHFTAKTVGISRKQLRLMGVDLSSLAGVAFTPGEVPDELMDAISDAQDSGLFPVRVKRTRYKDGAGDVKYRNEVSRFIDPTE